MWRKSRKAQPTRQSIALINFFVEPDSSAWSELTIGAALTGDPGSRRIAGHIGDSRTEKIMALFLIEREFAEALELDASAAAAIKAVNADVGVNWLFSFLSADRKKTYCLYEAPSADAIREAARLNHIPADLVIEVSQLRPEAIV
jgi:hypothetical protein